MIGTYRLRKPIFSAQWFDGDYNGHAEINEFIRDRVDEEAQVDWHYTLGGSAYVTQHRIPLRIDDRDYVFLLNNGDVGVMDEDTFSELFEFVDMVHDPNQLTLI